MSEIIKVKEISKAYRIGVKDQAHDNLVSAVTAWLKSPFRNFRKLRSLSRIQESESSSDIIWALKDVSFEVNSGEVLGIIGKNGAGKSTLLKIIAGITEPTGGRIEIYGRIASLLEVGTGFNPELTGRENVYLNGTILGMTKKEIDSKFDEIIDFSGVEKFVDTPIKRYSSGMKVRLAFAVAAFLEPEILIVDEVLAVGDAEFQKKCIGKMEDISSRDGRTVLFVSHNMTAVKSLCSRLLLIENGEIKFNGEVEKGVSEYLSSLRTFTEVAFIDHPNRRPGMESLIRDLKIYTGDGTEAYVLKPFEDITFSISVEAEKHLDEVFILGLGIYDNMGNLIVGFKSDVQDTEIRKLHNSVNVVSCLFRNVGLVPGEYFISVALTVSGEVIDYIDNAVKFEIESKDVYGTGQIHRQGGYILPDAKWT